MFVRKKEAKLKRFPQVYRVEREGCVVLISVTPVFLLWSQHKPGNCTPMNTTLNINEEELKKYFLKREKSKHRLYVLKYCA